MADFPGLSFSENEGRLIARNQPVAQRPPLHLESLRSLLNQAGYGQWFLLEDALVTLVARSNAAPNEFEMPVGERRDGSFKLEIARDASCAWVTLVPPYGGKAVEPDDILRALGKEGVVFGIDEPTLWQACATGAETRVVAASGVPPQNGEDARFEPLIDVSRERAPQLDENGLIDFRELGEIPTVEASQHLMRRIPPTAGVNGQNVRGQVTPAKPGRDQKFADKLVGTSLAGDDPNLLCAAVKGQPVHVGNGILVEQVVHVKSVNIATGNITFDGSVHVDGDVLNGMHVHASGDIVVNGTIDGGILEAGGNVQVDGGIIANAKVKAAGSVSVRFVENSQIYAGTVIAIDDMALQADLQALNQIMVGIKSPQRGRLVGGSARAMMLVQTPFLGGAASGNTRVQVGVNPELDARHQHLVQLAEKQHTEEENLKKLLTHLVKTGDKNMAERAKASWTKAVQAWAQTLAEIGELDQQLTLLAGAKVEVTQGVAGAVDLTFGKKLRPLNSNYDAGTFTLVEDRIVFTGLDGRAIDLG